MLLAMSKIMFEIVAFGLKGIIVFVFHFPTSATGLDNGADGLVRDEMAGGKGIFIELLTIGSRHGQFRGLSSKCDDNNAKAESVAP